MKPVKSCLQTTGQPKIRSDMIFISSDWSEVDNEIDRLEKMPTAKTKVVLGAVLKTGFTLTQEAVHVESGTLKESGKMRADSSRAQDQWEGEITYGQNEGPADYAIYEKRRGTHWVGPSSVKGDHDFFSPLEALHPLWIAAILEGLRR